MALDGGENSNYMVASKAEGYISLMKMENDLLMVLGYVEHQHRLWQAGDGRRDCRASLNIAVFQPLVVNN